MIYEHILYIRCLNKFELIFNAVKWFQVFLSYTNNSMVVS